MSNNVIFGKYISGNSKLHSLHPFSKILSCLLMIMTIILSNSLLFLVIITLFLILVIYLSKISWNNYWKSLWAIRYFLLLLWLLNGLFLGNLLSGFTIVWKLILVMEFSSILLYTTSLSSMIYGLTMLLSPLNFFHVSPTSIAFSLALALHFVPILLDKTKKIWQSQISRGFTLVNLTLKEKLSALKAILLPSFILSLRKADILANAMEVRLFDLHAKRSYYGQTKLKMWEKLLVTFFALQFLVVLCFEVIL